MGFKEVLQGALRGVRVAREHGETFNKAARFGAKLGVDVARAGGVGPYVDSKVIPFLGDLLDGKVRVERGATESPAARQNAPKRGTAQENITDAEFTEVPTKTRR